MSGLIAADPVEYTAASVSFGAGIATGVELLYGQLLRDLADTDAMAGHDSAGRQWGQRYDTNAPEVLGTIWSLQVAAVKLATMLERTGFNHSYAETMSDSAHRAMLTDTTDYAGNAPSAICPDIPKAEGGSGDYPKGWSLVRGSVGFEWPDGQQGRLRSAATAWSAAGHSLRALTHHVDEAVASIALQHSPEVSDATIACRAMKGHLTDTASMCDAMATSCRQLAHAIDTVHHQSVQALEVLVTLSSVTQFLGGIFAAFSFGSSEVVAQVAEGGEIEAVAYELSTYLATFTTEVGQVVMLVSGVDSEVLALGRALQPILDADLITAEPSLVADLDSVGVLLPEVQADDRLAFAASGGSRRALWTSWANYPKIVRDGRTYASIGDRLYTRHAVDRLQPYGLGAPAGAVGAGRSVSPNMVDYILKTTEGSPMTGPKGQARLSYISGSVEVITEDDIVITVVTR